ncbi:ThuA domain-containing protein [Planctomicrobium sp. SH668]|uniref:ThuA domain-containing protein n=1 Tax=Planctomicrobium sp. SH668 TaxID=3448126 RepID=UPI003F5CB811
MHDRMKPICPINRLSRIQQGILRFALLLLLGTQFLASRAIHAQEAEAPLTRKIVLIAGPKSHGPVGNGIHDYPWSVKLLKVMLDNSNITEQVRVEYHLDGWPEDPTTLDDADTIMVISDGRDGELYEEAPHFNSEENRQQIAKQIQRGCGFVTFHFSTFAPDAYAEDILNWSGAYFDWEENGERKWYSAIQTMDTGVDLAAPEHPIARGMKPFQLNEEFYFNLRFQEGDTSVTPILSVTALPGRDENGRVVAWAKERSDKGRGFGTTCGHFYENWKNDDFRCMILNALAWTAHLEVPESGIQARYYTHDEITAAITGKEGTEKAVVNERPIRGLILSGAHHPGHPWQATTPILKETLERDPRIRVDVSEEIEVLATPEIHNYDFLVQNYCNWEKPGLSDEAKAGFKQYLADGGGLLIIHFANGAFHFSLPNASESEWPEYREICRRVWDHTPGLSGHDNYGKFIVDIEDQDHPITKGMEPFQTTDELYFRQQGTLPIHVLATAKSNVTGESEPMAFVYEYESGRVFQTVLGHAAESLETDGTSELIRRAGAWVARQDQIAPLPKAKVAAEPAELEPELVEGKWGQALDAAAIPLMADGVEEYGNPPVTIELWARIEDAQNYQILAAHELKSSGTHWELFAMPGSGFLTAYLPGLSPDHVHSQINICDREWHHIAMTFATDRVCLYVDAQKVAEQEIQSRHIAALPGRFAIGCLVGRELGCNGLIDDVRITRGILPITLPTGPHQQTRDTIALWRLDNWDAERGSPDESLQKNSLRVVDPKQSNLNSSHLKIEGHWGEDALGFRWTEEDSVDGRWNQADIGGFLASIVPLPNQRPIAKGLSIRVGNNLEAAVVYDTGRSEFRAAWTGPFLKFTSGRYGISDSPQIAGNILFQSVPFDDDGSLKAKYLGMNVHGNRTVLRYQKGDAILAESPWSESHGGHTLITRTIETTAPSGVEVPLLSTLHAIEIKQSGSTSFAVSRQDNQATIVKVRGSIGTLTTRGPNSLLLQIPANSKAQSTQILYWTGTEEQVEEVLSSMTFESEIPSLAQWILAGPDQWGERIETSGKLGEDAGPYTLDTIQVPFNNPYRALMFLSDHDFFPNGDLAVCTVHGDVWIVTGIDEELKKVTWKRYATGLFQSLGLRVVDNEIYVIGRDQITRLKDLNNDGTADQYDCFYNGYLTSPGGHDYIACLERDSQGDFYFVHANLGVVRVKKDGSGHEVIASGLRNPNGLSIGPNDEITTTPQEGDWTPSSAIYEVKKGDFYGYLGPQVTSERPLGYNPPICWIPRLVDNSTGSQVWVTSDQWGPLKGQALSLSYGKSRLQLLLREQVGESIQGGIVDFGLDFDSGAMRGRFSPTDHQLYVSGLKGWVSNAIQDGCLQRVRYTGKEVDLPVQVRTAANGIAITFPVELDPSTANDVNQFEIQAWNYLYSANYGSTDYRVSGKLQEGRDVLDIQSATLLPDRRTVFLELPSLQPVMQMSIDCKLARKDGHPLRHTIYYTINKVGDATQDPTTLNQIVSDSQLSEDILASLQPGLHSEFQQGELTHHRVSRVPALNVEAGTPSSISLTPGSFQMKMTGYLQVSSKDEYFFSMEGTGASELTINGTKLLSVSDLNSSSREASISLAKGYHRFEIDFQSQDSGAGQLHLYWKSALFAREPIPPTVLFHDARSEELIAAQQFTLGRKLSVTFHCFRCHDSEFNGMSEFAMPELASDTPNLVEIRDRVEPDWIFNWLMNPAATRNHGTMPQLFHPESADDRQAAADITAWLTADRNSLVETADEVNDELITQGETLYSNLSCYTCHSFLPPEGDPEYDRISLHFTGRKFRPGMLEQFLMKPHAHYEWISMPDFGLSVDEANAIAAYLRQNSTGIHEHAAELAHADAARGKQSFVSRGCSQCHSQSSPAESTLTKQRSLFASPSYQGCLAENDVQQGMIPRFHFNQDQRDALVTFLRMGESSLELESPTDSAQRLTKRLFCSACHSKDDVSSPRASIFIDEFDTGFLPEAIPSLTWAGEKLKPDWMEKFFKGDMSYKPREHIKGRMPAFPAYAAALAKGLAEEHGHSLNQEAKTIDLQLVEIGHALTLSNTGLDCRQCHAVGRDQPTGDTRVTIAPGINFAFISDRLQHDFYSRFVMDPPRFDVNTKMPKLATDGKTTKIKSHFDGDAERQFEAIWHYIQTVDEDTSDQAN